VAEAISRHFNMPLGSVTKKGPGTEFTSPQAGTPRIRAQVEDATEQTAETHFRVVIVGAGPSGIGTAVGLARRGIHSVLLLDRTTSIGGIPAKYPSKPDGVPTFFVWRRGRMMFGSQYVENLQQKLEGTDAAIWLECHVIDVDRDNKSLEVVRPGFENVRIKADAIVFACGAREQTRSECGWIFGHRAARDLFSHNVLDLLDGVGVLPMQQPAILGSDLVAYAIAAKLRAAGADNAHLVGPQSRPEASLLARGYFRRWSRPIWHGKTRILTAFGPESEHGLVINASELVECDGLIFCGKLVPNSELVVAAGLDVDTFSRVPAVRGRNELSEPGWFVTGAERGGFHGAEWCFHDGLHASKQVSAYLNEVTDQR
jgi:glycine/D-amino acid oxidase-like deaminating enzyme